ncbi:hypothetical protein F3Y22_tig00003041pilonHSYRG00996 [Hibiscus syriacus]|uniref:SHSP domain-containing protein n=1 Tax=Hibiscus syriacus TaxID=106335 RepID=A0A6A3CMU4_HIBSY|nr:hypothetical protein F3Y22_tig00003041pilonHSYRG00996 [Hibiscus syriacus]
MAAAAEKRGNLDHLQRATTRPDKKRAGPVAPTGSWDRFPTARTVQQMMETMERERKEDAMGDQGKRRGVKEKLGKKKINGEEEDDEEEEEEEEWDAKSFGRCGSRIVLPENVEFEKIKAEVKDGVLYVTIPKPSRDSRILNIRVN